MQSETFRALVKPMETAQWLVWLAFVAAIPTYVCVAYMQFGRSAPGVTPPRPMPLIFTISLVILSLLAAALAPYMPRLLLPDSRLRQLINQPPEAMAREPWTGVVFEDWLARIRTLSPDEQRLFAIFSNVFVGFIVRLAFNESIVLYGYVLAFLSRSFVLILPFAVASLALNFMVPSLLDTALKRAASLGLESGNMGTWPR